MDSPALIDRLQIACGSTWSWPSSCMSASTLLWILGHEPNDFGAEFAPAVDFAAIDFMLSPGLTLRLGPP